MKGTRHSLDPAPFGMSSFLGLGNRPPGFIDIRRDRDLILIHFTHERQGAARTGCHAKPAADASESAQSHAVTFHGKRLHLAPFDAGLAIRAQVGVHADNEGTCDNFGRLRMLPESP